MTLIYKLDLDVLKNMYASGKTEVNAFKS